MAFQSDAFQNDAFQTDNVFTGGSGQAQADIKATYNSFAQSQADIKATNNGFGQAQALVETVYIQCGQAQATIRGNVFAQAQAFIRKSAGYGQAQGDIKSTNNAFAQAQAEIATAGNPGFQCDAFDNGAFQVDCVTTFTGFFAQAQADIKQTNTQSGQSNADIKTINYGFGQANADIKTQGYGSGQAQGSITNVTAAFAQAQADIKQTEFSFGQSQADIKAIEYGFGQANADILANGFGFGQAQASIIVSAYGFGQAQADIKQVGFGSGQSQADIKAVNSQFGQVNADIKATNNAFGQAQARILTTGGTSQFGQAQAYIYRYAWIIDTFTRTTTAGDLGQPDIAGPPYETTGGLTFPLIPSNVYVDGTKLIEDFDNSNGTLEMASVLGAQNIEAYVEFSYSTVDANAFQEIYLRVDGNFASFVEFGLGGGTSFIAYFYPGGSFRSTEHKAYTLLDGETYVLRAQVVDQIAKFKYWKKSDPEPDWIHIEVLPPQIDTPGGALLYFDSGSTTFTTLNVDNYNVYQLDILDTTVRVGYAQASIRRTVTKSAQAQAKILKSAGYGQAQADILRTFRAFAQAQAWINQSSQSGQALADILKTTFKHGLARARIDKSAGYGQALADIIKVTNKHGLARAKIIKPAGYGQAQSAIKRVYSATGQARAVISKPSQYGQAAALIDSPTKTRSAQAQAYVLGIRKNTGQALAMIQKYPFMFAQTQADIKVKSNTSAQAQASIVKPFCSGQAQAYIINGQAHGQAQCVIINRGLNFAQAQAYINRRQGYGQAQAVIKHSNSGQAQALIGAAKIKTGLAQGLIVNPFIFVITYKNAQAQAYIRKTVKYGQAQANIKRNVTRSGQAQCLITNQIHSGQAQAYIDNDRYLVAYNGKQLPGYAQSESFESVENIQNNPVAYKDGSLSEYFGLQNKLVSLRFKVVGENLGALKTQIDRASTTLRTVRTGFTKLNIKNFDKYYLGMVKTITTEHDVRTNKVAEYSVDFEVKPWLISEQTHTISGTGLIDTQTRDITNGGWTPTRLRVTGTDITISGYTATEFTGFISISGAVNNLVINAESYTATIGGVNKNGLMNNLDYALYVGPAKTYFMIDGADECTIEWEDRWYL